MKRFDPVRFQIAWLESATGEVFPLRRDADVTIGRTPNNQLVIDDRQISRNHAVIRYLGKKGYVLMDVGSTNGTFHNQIRINKPTSLKNGDVLEFGSVRYVFKQNNFQAVGGDSQQLGQETVYRVVQAESYLLIIDIIGFTKLSQKIPSEELAMHLEKWTHRCSAIIRKAHGNINQYLGDAVFSFWRESSPQAAAVLNCLRELWAVRVEFPFSFRMVLHFGMIRFGGMAVSGVETVIGAQVNYVFRMERLASQLESKVFLSAPAAQALGVKERARFLGEHPVKDFPGVEKFYDLQEHLDKAEEPPLSAGAGR